MNEQNQFDWVDFYKEFASKLLDYKDRRDELVEKVKAIYTMTGMNMPTLEKDNNLIATLKENSGTVVYSYELDTAGYPIQIDFGKKYTAFIYYTK